MSLVLTEPARHRETQDIPLSLSLSHCLSESVSGCLTASLGLLLSRCLWAETERGRKQKRQKTRGPRGSRRAAGGVFVQGKAH